MRVEEVMTRNPLTCSPEERVATAAWRMWEGDCGLLPVMRDGSLVGVVTDRDIAIALALRGRRADDLRVAEVQQGDGGAIVCSPQDTVSTALEKMRQHRLRRLPVVADGSLVGVVSLNDLVLAAAPSAGKAGQPTYREIVQSLQSICSHRGAECQAAA
jgi:CBS domain-containing protein